MTPLSTPVTCRWTVPLIREEVDGALPVVGVVGVDQHEAVPDPLLERAGEPALQGHQAQLLYTYVLQVLYCTVYLTFNADIYLGT